MIFQLFISTWWAAWAGRNQSYSLASSRESFHDGLGCSQLKIKFICHISWGPGSRTAACTGISQHKQVSVASRALLEPLATVYLFLHEVSFALKKTLWCLRSPVMCSLDLENYRHGWMVWSHGKGSMLFHHFFCFLLKFHDLTNISRVEKHRLVWHPRTWYYFHLIYICRSVT